jgi:acetoin utilization deacetylase AcuC-like enzyme
MARYVYSPRYYCDLGVHVFRTEKYALLYREMLRKGLARKGDFATPRPLGRRELLLAHTEEYVEALLARHMSAPLASGELPINEQIVDAFLLGAGGTLKACRLALRSNSLTMNLGGGFHHAFPDRAEGFCLVNDVAVSLRALMEDGLVQRPMVVDCDLHQGNGTAYIFRDDPDVFTFSIHQENLYPVKQRSDADVSLPDYCPGDSYLDLLRRELLPAFDTHAPDFVLYVAGADPYAGDMLGSLSLTLEDIRVRDSLVLGECRSREIPSTVVLAGGYCRRVEDTVRVHYQAAHALALLTKEQR